MFELYKKMAGTAAVFVNAELAKASPVERDGMVWSAQELHLDELTLQRHIKPEMASVLALEGLEEYDPPQDGDVRLVDSLQANFVYHQRIKGWLQVA